jgi:hypothetical protein
VAGAAEYRAVSREGNVLKFLKIMVVGLMVSALMALGGVALAQTGSDDTPPEILPDRITKPGPVQPPAIGPTIQDRGQTLPFTGGDVTLFVIVGAGAIALGTVAVRAARAKSDA